MSIREKMDIRPKPTLEQVKELLLRPLNLLALLQAGRQAQLQRSMMEMARPKYPPGRRGRRAANRERTNEIEAASGVPARMRAYRKRYTPHGV